MRYQCQVGILERSLRPDTKVLGKELKSRCKEDTITFGSQLREPYWEEISG
ncbi:hypothetical protein HID58_043626 [Brassica napus]|uniref:Uncharacterized protein n=1 Tax=Brassica napus TaxID=3708 RepID=A0ABQ8BH89_BRANA|nr:hypothetical protein HID58_043626 [Brassica napus]